MVMEINKKKLSKQLIKRQNKPCCKYWITMWIKKIAKAIKDTNGGEFNYCPECRKHFKSIDDLF